MKIKKIINKELSEKARKTRKSQERELIPPPKVFVPRKRKGTKGAKNSSAIRLSQYGY